MRPVGIAIGRGIGAVTDRAIVALSIALAILVFGRIAFAAWGWMFG